MSLGFLRTLRVSVVNPPTVVGARPHWALTVERFRSPR
jgi:hypothetical protein